MYAPKYSFSAQSQLPLHQKGEGAGRLCFLVEFSRVMDGIGSAYVGLGWRVVGLYYISE